MQIGQDPASHGPLKISWPDTACMRREKRWKDIPESKYNTKIFEKTNKIVISFKACIVFPSDMASTYSLVTILIQVFHGAGVLIYLGNIIRIYVEYNSIH